MHRNKVTAILVLFLLITNLSGCGRVRNKTKEVADKVIEKTESVADKAEALTDKVISKTEEVVQRVEKKLDEQSERLLDGVFAPCDYVNPDSKNNKKRFSNFLNVEVTPDVYNIYCYLDEMPMDVDYMFSFNCSPSTSEKIIKVNKFTTDKLTMGNAFNLQDDFDWWDKSRMASLKRYSWTEDKGYYKYYWYDAEEGKAYYFAFSI